MTVVTATTSVTITAPTPILDHYDGPELKEFVIFRLDKRGSRELADESSLLLEAERYADLMTLSESREGWDGSHEMQDVHEEHQVREVHYPHYEVRCAATGRLLYTTGDTGQVSAAIA